VAASTRAARGPGGEILEGGDEATVLEQRRHEALGERAEFVEGLCGLRSGLAQEDPCRLRIGVEASFCGCEVHLQPDEALLRTVVDVTFEPPHGSRLR
jgi:hypothetical protein